jgi:hypothetical protein
MRDSIRLISSDKITAALDILYTSRVDSLKCFFVSDVLFCYYVEGLKVVVQVSQASSADLQTSSPL